uniref:Uncharacterized protein n=1 Tax=viral metagenome TaxID=1070528 RepID=A0A6C0JTP8_9ZZZZ
MWWRETPKLKYTICVEVEGYGFTEFTYATADINEVIFTLSKNMNTVFSGTEIEDDENIYPSKNICTGIYSFVTEENIVVSRVVYQDHSRTPQELYLLLLDAVKTTFSDLNI